VYVVISEPFKMKFWFLIFTILFVINRAENDRWSSEEYSHKIVCDSTSITIRAHVNDLYNNFPETRWDEVRLIIGTCNGTAKHESGWITETFELGSCGGNFTQNGDDIIGNIISVGWDVCGARELTRWKNLVISSKRGFNAKCLFKNVVTVSTDIQVLADCINMTSSESLIVTDSESTGSFDDLFSLSLYEDSWKTTLAEDITTGDKP
jgi:hypothetical protein